MEGVQPKKTGIETMTNNISELYKIIVELRQKLESMQKQMTDSINSLQKKVNDHDQNINDIWNS